MMFLEARWEAGEGAGMEVHYLKVAHATVAAVYRTPDGWIGLIGTEQVAKSRQKSPRYIKERVFRMTGGSTN